MKAGQGQAGKILVVDDEETMRRSLADILLLEGYQVQTAASGEAALDILGSERYDLILLDLRMPGMDGLQVLKAAAQIAPDSMVIFLTAHGSLESAIEALRLDAFDYLLKPASPQQVIASVGKAFQRRSEQMRRRKLLDTLDASLQELREAEARKMAPELSMKPGSVPSGGLELEPGIYLDLERREIRQVDLETEQALRYMRLTPAEVKLMKALMDNVGKVLSHRQLVFMVQGYEVTEWEAPEVLRPLVSRLRQKLSAFPGGEEWVVSVRGSGYMFDRRQREQK